MLPADVNQLVAIYKHLSEESLYQRFREPAANLPPQRVLEEARALAEAGYTRGQGLLAFALMPSGARIPVAGARYIRITPHQAEVAITVRDDFQKKGIGAELLRQLVLLARDEGIRELTANISSNNRAVLQLMNNMPYPQKRERFGTEMTITFDITGQIVDGEDDRSERPANKALP